MTASHNVLVLGATGLVGRALVTLLLREPSVLSVVALVRRSAELPRDAKLRVATVDFDKLEQHADTFRVGQIFCALGTTIRQAGTQEQFRRVDHDYPVAAAELGLRQGATHYLLVSAMGANSSSRVFYNRVKGDTERDISRMGYQSVTIARPSLLVGPRAELRLGERIGQLLGFLTPPSIRPIPANDVAAALTLSARSSRHGIEILTSKEMRGASVRLSNA